MRAQVSRARARVLASAMMDMDADDGALLDAIADGDAEAKELFVRRHALALVTEARLLGARQFAVDLANEILAQAFEHPKRAKRRGFMRWAVAQMKDELERWKQREFEHLSSSALVSLSTSLSQRAVRSESLEAVQDAVKSLPQTDRTTLTLIYDEGLSPVEAAKVLGLQTSSVRARLSRIRRRLARLLGVDGHDT